MSRDSLSTQDTQSEGGASISAEQAESYGLRKDLYAQILQMSPADSPALAEMMSLYRSAMGVILQVAASHMGNAAVQRAIEIVKQKDARGSNHAQAGSMNDDQQHTLTTDASDLKPIKHSEYGSFLNDPSDPAHAEPGAKPEPAVKKAEPAWVAGARAFNDAHPELVAEFNDLTDDMCCDDDDGRLDPQAVASWQGHHGLPADGKVGPHTVATAKAAKTTAHAPAAPVSAAAPT
jgi:hypothetical protein